MPPSDGWYFAGPLIALTLVGVLACGVGRGWRRRYGRLGELYATGLELFAEREDYGLLSPAAIAEDDELAEQVRVLLTDAGIRSTLATRRDGRVTVLVFAEQVDQARRLVGGSAERQ